MPHIIPFEGRQNSGTYKLNLLFQDDKTYLMDNHLAASWCWLREIDVNTQYNLFHIDRHYDLLKSQLDWWIEELERQNVDLQNIGIQELTALRYNPAEMRMNDEGYQILRWDNYLTIFNRIYPNVLNLTYFATHKDGDTLENLEMYEPEIWDLHENMAYWINENDNHQWIVNLDIDYFFIKYEDEYLQFLTDDYVLKIAEEIKKSMEKIDVLTIALSPEFCGGWENSMRVAKLITDHLEVEWVE
ncbi:hypothetical protein SAMN05192588_0978 [Nonlabens sp. Hel1_33_55]|uniref:UPF0489 family protein n=1 Tax=Nonlabens sp. Hel1_33_55 TaxID=1336802 RepID=UPI000875B6E6|nr:UPF0489 family protein [Nonlabens sp. Hel1_33_55]SCY06869.1 hypothetical protein SAMN05192588_0978 [Nonlabens sp. Hel1_33_55]